MKKSANVFSFIVGGLMIAVGGTVAIAKWMSWRKGGESR